VRGDSRKKNSCGVAANEAVYALPINLQFLSRQCDLSWRTQHTCGQACHQAEEGGTARSRSMQKDNFCLSLIKQLSSMGETYLMSWAALLWLFGFISAAAAAINSEKRNREGGKRKRKAVVGGGGGQAISGGGKWNGDNGNKAGHTMRKRKTDGEWRREGMASTGISMEEQQTNVGVGNCQTHLAGGRRQRPLPPVPPLCRTSSAPTYTTTPPHAHCFLYTPTHTPPHTPHL